MHINIIKWLNSKGFAQGIFWIICSTFFSNLNDICTRLAGTTIPAMQITFFRSLFGTMILLPFLLYQGKSSFYVKNKLWHSLRVIVGFGAFACWIYGATLTTLPSITTISFTCPIMVLPLAYLFLGEKSDWRRITAVGTGFLGVVIVAFFEKGVIEHATGVSLFHPGVLFLFLAALLFALSDILNKKMLATESLFSLLFYFYLGTTIIGFIPALIVWKPIGFAELFYMFIQGFGGVSVLYCILKATNATTLSSIAPYRYFELVFSITFGYVLFNEIIGLSTIIGASLIIPSALLIAYYEINQAKKSVKKQAVELASEEILEPEV